MAEPTRAEVLAEAYRRGILPPGQRAAYEEAMRRGIVPRQQSRTPSFAGAGASAPAERRVSTAEDVGRAAWGGLVQGGVATGNIRNDMTNLGGHIGVNALAAGARAVGVPVDLVDRSSRAVGAVIDEAAPSTNALTQRGHWAGADYQAQTEPGRAAQTTTQMATGALLPGGILTRLGNVLIPAAGSEAAGLLAQQAGMSPEQEAAARVGGAIVSGGFTNPRGAVRPPRVPRPNPLAARVEAFDQAGITPRLSTVQGGRGIGMTNSVIADNPIAGVRVRAGARQNVAEAEAAAGRIAGRYGTPQTPTTMGEAVTRGTRRFAQDADTPGTFANRADQLYTRASAPIDAAERGVPAGTATIEAPQTQRLLTDLAHEVNAPSLSRMITNPRFGQLAQALQNDASQVRFGDLRRLRSWVRQAQRDPALRQDMSNAALQRLEAALTQDIYTNAARLGGRSALRDLQRADDYYRTGMRRINGALEQFGGTGEQAYARIESAAGNGSRGDLRALTSLRRSLSSQEWGDVASTMISRLGRSTPGTADAGEFSINQFVTRYNAMTPQARQVLFGSLGGGGARGSRLMAELDNLASVLSDIKHVGRTANLSQSFSHAQTAGVGAGLISHPLPTIATVGGMAGVGEAMSNPHFVRWLAQLPRYERDPRGAAQHLARLASIARADPAVQQLQQQLTDQSGSTPVLQPGFQEQAR